MTQQIPNKLKEYIISVIRENIVSMNMDKSKREALTKPREPVHHALKAEPILHGSEEYIYNLVKKFGLKHTLNFISKNIRQPGPPNRKQLWKNYLMILNAQKKKGLYTDFKESVDITEAILKEEKMADPTLANNLSKVKSHINTIRGAAKKKFANSYLKYCIFGEEYPKARDFKVPDAAASQIKKEIDDKFYKSHITQ